MSSQDLDVVICPDCGGVVGASAVTEYGPPCTCIASEPKPKARPSTESEPSRAVDASTTTPAEGAAADDASSSQSEKLCHMCGKNVAGHRRLKDSRGYICLDCAKKEAAQKKPTGVKCPKCFRVVKPETLGKHDGTLMCQRCLREAFELTRPGSKRFRKIDDSHFEEHSKTQLYVLLGIAIVLLGFIVVSWFRS